METYKLEANEKFFQKIIEVSAEGSVYVYPNAGELFTIVGGVMYGTKRGVEILKAITPKSFHANIKEQVEE